MIEVHYFGKFTVESSTGKLDEQKIHSKRIFKLLVYFLMNNNRMINAGELGEFLWGEGGSRNPIGALKNLVYRLRNTLKELGDEEYILSGSGAYGWNSEIPIHSDMMDFDMLAARARTIQGKEWERIEAYERAANCYDKPVTAGLTSESCLAVRLTYYNSLYIKLVRELSVLYNQVKAYEKMQQMCTNALECDDLNEDIHYWLIKSWVGMGDMDHALKAYEVAVKLLYEQLGIHRSRKMGELYEEILKMGKNSDLKSMEDIYDEIREPDPGGVFFCEYSVFREIYRLEARRVLRAGIAEYIVLLTINLEEGDEFQEPAMLQYYKKRAMDKLKMILRKSLRMGDVAARYCDTQYIIMLSSCSYEASQKVIKRIDTRFLREMGNKRMGIKSETREVSIEYDLPLEERGVIWNEDTES